MITGLILALILSVTTIEMQDSTSAQLIRSGNEALSTFQFEEARGYFQRALVMAGRENDQRKKLTAELRISTVDSKLYHFEPAINRASRVYEKSAELADTLCMIQALELIGSNYYQKRDLESALTWLTAYHELAAAAGNDDHLTNSLITLARVYNRMMQPERALETYHKSLEISVARRDTSRIISAYSEIAKQYSDSHHYRKSLEYAYKALKLSENMGNDLRMSTQLHNMATTYGMMGDFVTELQYATRALEIRRRHQSPSQISIALYNIAGMYYRAGQFEMALKLNQECLEIERQYSRPYEIIYTLTQNSSILEMLGRQDEARQYARDAIELGLEHKLWERILFPYRNLARSYITDHQPEKALAEISRALELTDSTGHDTYINELYMLRGNAYNLLGRHEEALQSYRTAFAYTRITEERETPPVYYFQIARGFRHTGSDSAFVYAREFIERTGRHRENFRMSAGMRAGFMSRFIEHYHEIARWHLEDRDDTQTAYGIIELARARTFAENVADAAVDFSSLIDEDLQIELQKAVSDLRAAEARYSRLRTEEAARNLRDAGLAHEVAISRIRSASDLFDRFHDPEPLSLDRARKLIGLNTAVISYSLSGTHLTAIAFSPTHTRHWVTSLEDSGADGLAGRITEYRNAIETGAAVPELTRLGAELTRLLIEPATDIIRPESNLILITDGALSYLPFETLPWNGGYLIEQYNVKYVPSMTVYSLLHDGRDRRGPTDRDVLILSNPEYGVLHQYSGFINTSLLRLPHTRIEADSVAYRFRTVTRLQGSEATETRLAGHDLSRYRYIHLATHGIVNEQNPRLSGLVMAAPAASRVGRISGPDGRERDAGNSRGNGNGSGNSSGNGDAYGGRIGSISGASGRADGADVTEAGPLNGRKYGSLTGDAAGGGDQSVNDGFDDGDDAFLRIPEIHNLRLNADLVVLSACNTGLGQIMKGEGVLGLQRAFFLAGTTSVMVSLWAVQDRSTSTLMSRFYREIQRLDDERSTWRYRIAGWFSNETDLYGDHAVALRNAKLEMIGDIRFHHPRHWGGFVVIGL
jgi:CHAT domain-containing protein